VHGRSPLAEVQVYCLGKLEVVARALELELELLVRLRGVGGRQQGRR